MKKFEIVILETVRQFLKSLDKKASTKIVFNMRKAQVTVDPELFKKLTMKSGNLEQSTTRITTGS